MKKNLIKQKGITFNELTYYIVYGAGMVIAILILLAVIFALAVFIKWAYLFLFK